MIEQTQQQKKDFVKLLLDNNILVGKEMLSKINEIDNFSEFYASFKTGYQSGAIRPQNTNILSLIAETGRKPGGETQETATVDPDALYSSVKVIFSYEGVPKKREIQDFVSLFNNRYNALKSILMKRKELESPTSMNRAKTKTDGDETAVIGMVFDKQITKNGHVMLTLEDSTETMKVLINKNKPELLELAKDCVYDEVVGVTGTARDNMFFANNLLIPDIPMTKELKKAPDEVYAAFISDMHFGSKVFMHEEWNKFLKWISLETGSDEQKELASKIKYLFLVGDLVEGVGIYPGQEEDLDVKDIYEQYKLFAGYLKQIPKSINIIVCPGNHDAMRLAEPQPPLYKDIAAAIYELPNVTVVSNPSIVRIHEKPDFPGFDVLLYHGFSYIYYSNNIERIRSAGGQQRVDLIMQFLLQRRHLAPSHESNLYLPDIDKDHMVIEKVPDIFISGHIHRAGVFNYRNVQTVECSCWLRTTDYQEKMGLKPQPARVPIINLKTRKPKILKFGTEDKQEE